MNICTLKELPEVKTHFYVFSKSRNDFYQISRTKSQNNNVSEARTSKQSVLAIEERSECFDTQNILKGISTHIRALKLVVMVIIIISNKTIAFHIKILVTAQWIINTCCTL